jgi:uncharacterized membrane protein
MPAMLHLPNSSYRLPVPLTLLILGLMLFFIPHLLREMGLRQRAIAALPSESAYKGVYSLLAVSGLGLIIWGKSQADFSMMWEPIFELRYISHILMIPALILVAAGNMPMSLMRRNFRNPMLLGVTIWGLAHLWSNGDLASMLLFGGFSLWAGLKFVSRGVSAAPATREISTWRQLLALLKWDILAIVVGLGLFLVIFLFHGQLFGVGLSNV